LRKAEGRDLHFEVIQMMQEAGYQDLWRNLNEDKKDGDVVTCKWNCRIDYIWLSAGLWAKVKKEDSFCMILRKNISDHFPVCSGLTFKL
jgi:exonuclease III